MDFTPDYRHFADAMRSKRPTRLSLYERIVSPEVMEEIMGTPVGVECARRVGVCPEFLRGLGDLPDARLIVAVAGRGFGRY